MNKNWHNKLDNLATIREGGTIWKQEGADGLEAQQQNGVEQGDNEQWSDRGWYNNMDQIKDINKEEQLGDQENKTKRPKLNNMNVNLANMLL